MPFSAEMFIALHNKVIFCIEIEFNKLNNNNNLRAKVFRPRNTTQFVERKDALILKSMSVDGVDGMQMLDARCVYICKTCEAINLMEKN